MTRPDPHETLIRLGRHGFCAYCSCGWATPYSWSKANADQARADHEAQRVAASPPPPAIRRHFLALLACAALVVTTIAGAACTSPARATSDAGPPPTCTSVGCGDEDLYCTRAGRCTCPQPSGDVVECERPATPPDDAQLPDADR
jgi:hypothetical protein